MAKINGNEVSALVLRGADGSVQTLPVEDSGGGGGGGNSYANLNAFLSVDDGEWIPITKTVNWNPGLENFQMGAWVNRDFVTIAGASEFARNALDFTGMLFNQNGPWRLLADASYSYGTIVLSAAETASTDGRATRYPFTTAPEAGANSVEKFSSTPGELIVPLKLTFKADESTQLDTMVLVQYGYQWGRFYSYGIFNLGSNAFTPANGAVHNFKLKFTW